MQIWNIPTTHHILRVFPLVTALAIVLAGAQLVFRDEPDHDMRQGDAMFGAGRYYAAWQIYRSLASQHPSAQSMARLGMIQAVRGEHAAASRSFGSALRMGVAGRDYTLVRLYQGSSALAQGYYDDAIRSWRLIDDHADMAPYARVLEAEALLRGRNYAAAEQAFDGLRQARLPQEWRWAVQLRLATLRASDSAGEASALLGGIGGIAPALPDPLMVAPLLPKPSPAPDLLAAAIQGQPDERAMQLGQAYLSAGMAELALAQFDAVPSDSPLAVRAQSYAAYTRLRTGDAAGGIGALNALVRSHPNDTQLRAMLALASLETGDTKHAEVQVKVLRQIAPNSPNTYLAWAQWYAAQSEYIEASSSYQKALAAAPPDQRGTYLTETVRFHLTTTVRICENGRPAAQEAALLVDSSAAWAALAQAQIACGNFAEAERAASTAQQRDPRSAEASFYLGKALALRGQRGPAREALVAAADLAPDSDWRAKAEAQLSILGL
ncbi:tetratricopeptide repeat protein [Chloroflexia bacterium SDU3-3]|nr:tetratricopeptide repeat protein [Chloroflexia bacterium SDU3-3]